MDVTTAREEGVRIPDILDAIAALSSDAVPTPPVLARAMLDLLPSYLWSEPTLRWLDPAVKSGSILREIGARLMEGLAVWEPDVNKRVTHIMQNMLYGLPITLLHGEMGRRSVYLSKDANGPMALAAGEMFDNREGNIEFVRHEHAFKKSMAGREVGNCTMCGAPAGLERGLDRENYAYEFIHSFKPADLNGFVSEDRKYKGMKFDVVVGNPPYQSSMEEADGTKAANIFPLYHRFVENAIALDPKYALMIVPSRWFAGGKGLDEFRARMIADRRIRAIVDNPKLFDCFPGVEIKGGVNYFLWDREYHDDCEFSTRIDGIRTSTAVRDLRSGDGVLIRDNAAALIVTKVRAREDANLGDTVSKRDPFGQSITTNFRYSESTPFTGAIPLVYGSHVGYIREDQIERHLDWVNRWKVLIPKAGDGHGREVSYVLGEPIALAPGSICTQTYLVAGVFDTREETENFARYLTTKFVRFMVLQRKLTQQVVPDVFRFVPALDMSREWSDSDLYKDFALTQDEIDYIESTIHPRDAILSLDAPVPASHLPGGSKYRPPGMRTTTEAAPDEDEE